MSLKERLASVENRSYQPVFTANLNFNKYLTEHIEKQKKTRVADKQQRPKTALSKSIDLNQKTSRGTSRLSTNSRPLTSLANNKSVSFKKPNDHKSANDEEDIYEHVSETSTNLSMFSLAQSDHTLPKMKKYNQFNYRSYFERYMNRRAVVKIPTYNMPT